MVLLLLLLAVSSQRHWQHHAAELERDNLDLQLQQLREHILAQSSQLADRAGDLAQSDAVVDLLPDNAPLLPDRAALLALTRHRTRFRRWSSQHRKRRGSARKLAEGSLADCPPDPELMRYVESAARAPDVRSIRTPHFADGRWLVARPIASRSAPTVILGWLAAAKSLSIPAATQLASPVSLLAKPLWAFDAARLPPELLAPAKPTGQGFAITTHLSSG